MNEIINKFLLVGDKFMLEIHLRHPGFTDSAWGTFTKKTKKQYKNLKKVKIQGRFIKTNLTKLASSMILFMDILRIYREEQLLIRYYVIKHLILLKIPKYEWYQKGLASLVYKFSDKNSFGAKGVLLDVLGQSS